MCIETEINKQLSTLLVLLYESLVLLLMPSTMLGVRMFVCNAQITNRLTIFSNADLYTLRGFI